MLNNSKKFLQLVTLVLFVCFLTNLHGVLPVQARHDDLVSYSNERTLISFKHSSKYKITQYEPTEEKLLSIAVVPVNKTTRKRSDPVTITIFKNNFSSISEWLASKEADSYPFMKFFEKVSNRTEFTYNKQKIITFDHRIEGATVRQILIEQPNTSILGVSYMIDNKDAPQLIETVVESLAVGNNNLINEENKNSIKKVLAEESVMKFEPAVAQVSQLTLQGGDSFRLPWENNVSHVVTQAWNTGNHIGTSAYAYDFDMSNFTELRASSAGTVTIAKGDSTVCGGWDYRNDANYIVINHSDSATLYLHLKVAEVTSGNVVQGQRIGLSGDTGYTDPDGDGVCGQHLHFQRQATGGWFTQSQSVYFDEYPDQQLPNGCLEGNCMSENYGVSTACGITNVVITNREFNQNVFNCTALSTMMVSNTDVNNSVIVFTAQNGGLIKFQPGFKAYGMTGTEARFQASINQ